MTCTHQPFSNCMPIGIQDLDDGAPLELANCPDCGSTIAREHAWWASRFAGRPRWDGRVLWGLSLDGEQIGVVPWNDEIRRYANASVE